MNNGKATLMLAVVLFFVVFGFGVMFQIDREHTRNTVDPDAWAVIAAVEQQNQTWAPIVFAGAFMTFVIVLVTIAGFVIVTIKSIDSK